MSLDQHQEHTHIVYPSLGERSILYPCGQVCTKVGGARVERYVPRHSHLRNASTTASKKKAGSRLTSIPATAEYVDIVLGTHEFRKWLGTLRLPLTQPSQT